jgi:hypothetical protein
MEVVWQKGPGINLDATFLGEQCESGKEIVAILIGQKDLPSLDPSAYHMMQNARSI